MPDRRTAIIVALLALALPVCADEGMPIIFLPPPMEGTISLGIFDRAGKIVRVLHRDAVEKDFTVGENGFIARWDGRDGTGQPVPPGKYGAGGWMIGDLGVEGVAFHCNDWIRDDSPRFTRVTAVKNVGRDEVRVTLRTADGKEESLGWKLAIEGVEPPPIEVEAGIEDGKLLMRKGGASQPAPLGEGEKALSCVTGSGDRVWAIVETPEGREVRAYSAAGEFLRRLAYEKSEPQPQQIAASQWSEMIFLLEENATEQRLRSLALGASEKEPPKTGEGASGPTKKSAWRVTYLKTIRNSETFDAVAAHLGRTKPLKAETVVKLQTRPNPLLGDAKSEVSLKVKIDREGTMLVTQNDLPLTRLTTAASLKWAVLVHEGAALTLFQSDGVVVEEFKIAKPENMMSFDAGDLDLKPAGAKSAKPKGSPDAAPRRVKPLRPGDDL
jgi:hypothetical protein